MKKILIPIFILCFASITWATPWTGPLTGSINAPNAIYGTDGWNDVTFSWDISLSGGLYTYVYTFTDPGDIQKNLSHIIIEVSDDFTKDNIKPGTTSDWELGKYSGGPGNPGLPGTIYGLKFEQWDSTGENPLTFTFKIVTDKSPMEGNFYAKDGVYKPKNGDKIDVYAYSGSIDGFGYNIPVPNTAVPEPGVLILLGIAMTAVGVASRYVRKP